MSDEQYVAHLLRRVTFGPLPGQVPALAANGISAAIDAVLAAPPIKYTARASTRSADTSGLMKAWGDRMASPRAGLHEKMVWFWHGHFTSSIDKVGSAALMAVQHNTLRRHALGKFRDLAYAMTIDPAMLVWLDGDGSRGDAPNENYGREFMELFTISRTAGYTQADVVAAAQGFAGWSVSGTTAVFDPGAAYQGPAVTFLGQTRSPFDARAVVDAVCAHPNCARFIAAKVHRYLAGSDPSSARLTELAAAFAAADLDIRVLVEAILRHDSFLELRLNRPRYPVEWLTAARAAIGYQQAKTLLSMAQRMGQVPFAPPNVAGWGAGPQWLSTNQALAHLSFLRNTRPINTIADAPDPVAATLAHCSLHEVSDATVAALTRFAGSVTSAGERAIGLVALAMASPEAALA